MRTSKFAAVITLRWTSISSRGGGGGGGGGGGSRNTPSRYMIRNPGQARD